MMGNIMRGRKYIASSLLNIIGMAMAFAALYIIMVQVHYDLNYNKSIKDSDRVFIISVKDWYSPDKYMTYLARPVWEDVIENVSCVESGGVMMSDRSSGSCKLYSDPSSGSSISVGYGRFSYGALETFGVETVSGRAEDMQTSSDVAISEETAARLGVSVGDALWTNANNGKHQLKVSLIYKDFPKGTDLENTKVLVNIGPECIDDTSEWSYPYYVKLRSSSDTEEFTEKAVERIKLYAFGDDDEIDEEDLNSVLDALTPTLFSLDDLYFDHRVNSPGKQGSRTSTYTLIAIAFLILLIAFINFINFFFALVPLRIKSVNTRKILGTPRSELIVGIVMESLFLILMALALAAVIVIPLSHSSVDSLVSGGISLADHVVIALYVLGLAVVLCLLSSLYPAFYITSFPTALALRGGLGASSRGRIFRYALIGVQYVITFALIVCSVFVDLQRRYMLHYDMGFDKSQLLVVNATQKVASDRASCDSKLLSNPQIVSVAWADGEIVRDGRMGWGRAFKGEQINFKCYPVSWNFLQMMGIDIVEGRDFVRSDEQSENGTFIFNEAARDKFGLTLEDKMYGHRSETDIVGFCKNFNFQSLASPVEPIALYNFGKVPWRALATLYLRTSVNADMPSVIKYIRSAFCELDPELTESQVDVHFFDERLDSQYATEKNTSMMVTLFAILAIVISLMGVFGLVMFESEYRRKEIGIRRVNGATVGDILKMFNMKFVRIVLCCFVVAAPLSWAIVRRYLEGFAYRTPIYWWVFAAALAVVLLVTVAVVTCRSMTAAMENPCETLKRE